MSYMALMFNSFRPDWYRTLHSLPASLGKKYLFFLLCFHAILRTVMFYYWNYDLMHKQSFDSCIYQYENEFPMNIAFGMKKNDRLFFVERVTEGRAVEVRTTHLPIPTCCADYFGLLISFISKNSISPTDIWYSFAPVIVLSSGKWDSRVQKYMEENWKGFDFSLVTVTAQRATLLNFIPITKLWEQVVIKLCENEFSRYRCTKQNFSRAFRKLSIMTKDTHRLQFNVFVSMLISISIFTVALLDFLDLYFAAILLKFIANWSLFQYLLFLDTSLQEVASQLNLSFFMSLAAFTSTPIMLVNSTFPYPFADFMGTAAFLHLIFALFVYRKYALPSIRDSRHHQIAQPSTRNGDPSILVNADWVRFAQYQNRISQIFLEVNSSRKSKLARMDSEMTSFSKTLGASIVHVWSCLNNYQNPNDEDVLCGPGFCYGLSLKTGVYVLIGWYHSPLSSVGINLICKFPGQVLISQTDVCPTNLYQPNQTEIHDMNQKLVMMKQNLNMIRQREKAD